MLRRLTMLTLAAASLAFLLLAIFVGVWWWIAAGIVLALLLTGIWDVLQRRHSVLRNYPVIGHLRYLMEKIRPEMQQYFIERNVEGRPFNRDTRSLIYERAKGIAGEKAFGTERNVNEIGYEYLIHTAAPIRQASEPHRVRIGSDQCAHPYDMALLNVSAMSFGALSANAIRAMNKGAAIGGFAQDTGEGGLSRYHLEHGGDLVWEIGSGYFGARTKNGSFDAQLFAEKAQHHAVKCVSLKLSQGAKPGIGGVLPGEKVSPEIAAARGVPVGVTCVSPANHSAFSTPRELVQFLARMRELAGGKPVGFKLCIGRRAEFLAICKAIRAEGITPDFVIVDGAEGGTGAAPLEFEDHVGTPLTEGLMAVHNALVGCGLRDQIKVGASGKIASGSSIVKRMIQGADYTNAARAMMMATGCIQSQRCHTNHCPVGVATQDPKRAAALNVEDKSHRVARFQQATVDEAMRLMASMGAHQAAELSPDMLRRRVSHTDTQSYAELFQWLRPGELLAEPPAAWKNDWQAADPDTFAVPHFHRFYTQ